MNENPSNAKDHGDYYVSHHVDSLYLMLARIRKVPSPLDLLMYTVCTFQHESQSCPKIVPSALDLHPMKIRILGVASQIKNQER